MDNIDLTKYKFKEFLHEDNSEFNAYIQYLQGIIMDRTIHEEAKVDVRKQLDEMIRLKVITMKPPQVVLEKKE